MRIDGKQIAEEIRSELKTRVEKLKDKGITPKIAIITLGDESSWASYVKQKIKVADELGIIAVLLTLEDADEEKLLKTIHEVDSDPKYHGIIVQRPMPSNINRQKVIDAISSEKDIDGFGTESPFQVPVWLAVKRIIEQTLGTKMQNIHQNFVVLGKGETAGGPIVNGLKQLGFEPMLIDSKTQNPEAILQNADIIISAVGKSSVIKPENVKPDAILIGVGTHGEDGKLRGDYYDHEVEQKVKFYTPTPGGVGPVNLSFLFDNLVTAAEKNL